MEFLDSMISSTRKELWGFESLKGELTRKEDTIKRQDKLIEYLMKSAEGLSPDEVLNKFIDGNISYDFKYPNGLYLTEIYKVYCSWYREESELCPPRRRRHVHSMEYLKNYLDYRFKPSLCGRSEPFYVVYFGTSWTPRTQSPDPPP